MIKIAFILILLNLNFFLAASQEEKVKRRPYADMYSVNRGLHIGIYWQDLFLVNASEEGIYNGEWTAAIPSFQPGISVGIIGDIRLNEYLNFRISPTVLLGGKKLYFKNLSTETQEIHTIHSTYCLLPVDIKYSSIRLNNYRPYLIGGIFGIYDLGGKIKEDLRLKRVDYGISIGVGCNFYLDYFKLCPEIRFYIGLRNIWYDPAPFYTTQHESGWKAAVSKAKNRLITVTFNFE